MTSPWFKGVDRSTPSSAMPPETDLEATWAYSGEGNGRYDGHGDWVGGVGPDRRAAWWEPVYVFFITFIIFALLTPRFITYLNPVTGDEPFYLMTATSILKDGDINECNNYRQRDEAALYPALLVQKNLLPHGWVGWDAAPYPLPPHPAKIVPESRRCLGTNVKQLLRGIPGVGVPLPSDGSQSELYSKHGLGLSLLVTLPFGLGGRSLVVFFLNMLGALLAANIYLLAREATGKVWIGTMTWLAFAFTVPFMPYSFLIFPEMPAALLVVYAFRRIWMGNNNWVRLIAIGLCMAFLPWLHYRFIPVSAALFAFFVYRLFTEKGLTWDDRLKRLSPLLAPNIISAIWLMAYFYFLYRHIYPNLEDHAGLNDFDGTLRGIAGSFLDAQWGLFVYAPIYILAIVGVILMATHTRWRGDLLWVGVVFVPYFLIIANYAQWWGEWCPPARYLTSVLPVAALPFAVALDRIRSPLYKGVYGVLLAFSLVVTAASIYQPQWMYNQPDGTSVMMSRGLAEVVTKLSPDVVAQLPSDLQPYVDDKTDQLMVHTFGWFPSFVVPYFAYILEDGASGDYWVDQAWRHSVWPFVVISLIVIACLLLALWDMRKRRSMMPYTSSSPGDFASLPQLGVSGPERGAPAVEG